MITETLEAQKKKISAQTYASNPEIKGLIECGEALVGAARRLPGVPIGCLLDVLAVFPVEGETLVTLEKISVGVLEHCALRFGRLGGEIIFRNREFVFFCYLIFESLLSF